MSTFGKRGEPAITCELRAAAQEEAGGHVAASFRRLERAHVLGQASTTRHVATTRFAIVKYRQMYRTQERAVPLQPTDRFAPGDVVSVKVDDCTSPIAAASSNPRS